VEKAAWESFIKVTINSLGWGWGLEEGSHKAENCRGMVADLVQSYKAMGFIMALYVHLLNSETSSQKISGH
jgi:hypothetical protein